MTLSWGQGWLLWSFLLIVSTDSLRISRNQICLQPICNRFVHCKALLAVGAGFPFHPPVPGEYQDLLCILAVVQSWLLSPGLSVITPSTSAVSLGERT